ncbi:unnamed protein product [Cuscuta epithymum]|uniref:Uncharacterized protein n=1 Tax=Cuscuta epithymum TaxID=186058 RepID=A0AAV0F0Z8_9ASTE|nr:unnamed protein product [Cuscuta epithymum]
MGLIWYGDGMSQSPFISISGFNILRIPQPVIFSLNQFKSHFLFIQFIFISNKLNITMEIGKEQVGSSSSSLTEDLSAPKDSSQSPGIFSLLFPPLVRRPSSNSSSYLMECLDKQLYEFNFKHGRKNHKFTIAQKRTCISSQEVHNQCLRRRNMIPKETTHRVYHKGIGGTGRFIIDCETLLSSWMRLK